MSEVTFDVIAQVYFCPICGKTFTVTRAQYKKAEEKYREGVKLGEKIWKKKGITVFPSFELNGHKEWIYRPDQNYQEEIANYRRNKYEGTCCKS